MKKEDPLYINSTVKRSLGLLFSEKWRNLDVGRLGFRPKIFGPEARNGTRLLVVLYNPENENKRRECNVNLVDLCFIVTITKPSRPILGMKLLPNYTRVQVPTEVLYKTNIVTQWISDL